MVQDACIGIVEEQLPRLTNHVVFVSGEVASQLQSEHQKTKLSKILWGYSGRER